MRTTERLLLRPFREEDLAPWAALNVDPDVMMYLGGSPLSREESDQIAAGVNKRYAIDGTGFLAIERRTDGVFMELPHVISVTDTPNARSIAVMRRLGMSFDQETVLEEDGVPFDATIYRLTAEAWKEAWNAARK